MPASTAKIPAKFFQAVKKAHTSVEAAAVDRASFEADYRLGIEKFASLRSYREYLTAARAEKARRKTVPQSFERTVQTQARQALADMQAFGGAALRMAQKANASSLWDRAHDKALAGVKAAGPLNAQDLWNDVQASPAWISKLRTAGVTPDMETALSETIGSLDARLVSDSGQLAVEISASSNAPPARIPLGRTPVARPQSVTDLLRQNDFDRIVAAFEGQVPASLDIVPSNSARPYHLADLLAIGTVAGHQRLAEHVRKLEDTGLATYAGNDPVTVIVVLLVVGAAALIGGIYLADECDRTHDDTTCVLGFILLLLAMLVFACLAGALFGLGVANPGLAFAGLVPLGLAGEALGKAIDIYSGFEGHGTA